MFLELFLVATVVVVGLSLISEHISPRVAGIISGAPTGTAITLFFLGLSQGPQFAANSAIFNMAGMVAMQSLLFFYYTASSFFKRYTIFLSAAASVAGYLCVAWLLHQLPISKELAVVLPLISILLFMHLFRNIENVKIEKAVKLSPAVLLFRAILASLIISSIVMVSEHVGPSWTGLFSAFPTTLFPLILILNLSYGTKAVHTVIKNVPAGLPALVAYSLVTSVAYPSLGIYWGTVAAFAAALAYLAVYFYLKPSGRR